MSAKHTPGPWRKSCCDITDERPVGEDGVRFWSVAGEGPYRGDVCNVHAAEHIGGITITERDANACLIAAAPDLLAALVEAVDDLLSFAHSRGSEFEGSDDDLVGEARAAIARATGAA